jgi:hypothetical protein
MRLERNRSLICDQEQVSPIEAGAGRWVEPASHTPRGAGYCERCTPPRALITASTAKRTNLSPLIRRRVTHEPKPGCHHSGEVTQTGGGAGGARTRDPRIMRTEPQNPCATWGFTRRARSLSTPIPLLRGGHERGTNMTTIDIRDFQIVPERDSGRPIVAYEVEDFRRDGGDDYGAVIVRINVDGSFDLVQVDLVQTGDLAVLDRAIRALGDVRSELEVLYGAGGRGRGAAWRAGITGAVRRPRARGRPRVPHRGRVASRARRPVEGEGREGRELADVHSTRCPPRTRDLGGHRRVAGAHPVCR